MLATLNAALLLVIAFSSLALIFSKQLHALISRAQLLTARHAGIKVLVKRQYVDVNTGACFDCWRNIGGIRLALISAILKIF